VDWAFWVGTLVFVGTVGGLLWLRDRPLTDVDGRTVDEDGRHVPSRRRRVYQVVRRLTVANNVPHTGRLLRRLTGMSKKTFYRVVEHMLTRGWLERVTLHDDSYPYVAYRLSEYGRQTFNVM
jgi:hypothetical protein